MLVNSICEWMTELTSLRNFALYFLKLGSFGFGGPIALATAMHRDLVQDKKWISELDYKQGLALAQLAPGPLATQLAIYLGWIHSKNLGATLIGVAFVLPSFLMVILISNLYIRLGHLNMLSSAFYGVSAAVIALISMGTYKMAARSLKRDKGLWCIALVMAAITLFAEAEFLCCFLFAGVFALGLHWFSEHGNCKSKMHSVAWVFTGVKGPATTHTLTQIFLFFAKSGTMVFGSGLAIVPFLHSGVVNTLGWLNEQQFMDAVAIAMITPGPVVITVAFIGYLVAGLAGATAAALGIFLPCYLFVVVPAPYFQKISKNTQIKVFVEGITAAAVGAITGCVVILAKKSILDFPTLLIALGSLWVLVKTKTPEPIIILASAVAGIILKF